LSATCFASKEHGQYYQCWEVFKYYLYLNIKSAKSISVKYLNTLYKLSILNTI